MCGCGCVWVCLGEREREREREREGGREREKAKDRFNLSVSYNSNTSDLTILQRVLTFFFLSSSLSSEFSKRSLKSTESLSGSVLALSG